MNVNTFLGIIIICGQKRHRELAINIVNHLGGVERAEQIKIDDEKARIVAKKISELASRIAVSCSAISYQSGLKEITDLLR